MEDGKTVLLGFGGMSSLDEFIKTGRPNNDATFILNIQNSTGKSGQIGFPIASSIRSFVNGRKIHIQGIGNPLLNASKMTIPGSVFILSDVSNVELKLSDFTIQGKGGDTSGSAISEGSVATFKFDTFFTRASIQSFSFTKFACLITRNLRLKRNGEKNR